jgi:hypothetical protein
MLRLHSALLTFAARTRSGKTQSQQVRTNLLNAVATKICNTPRQNHVNPVDRAAQGPQLVIDIDSFEPKKRKVARYATSNIHLRNALLFAAAIPLLLSFGFVLSTILPYRSYQQSSRGQVSEDDPDQYGRWGDQRSCELDERASGTSDHTH